jgi:cation transport ATPase
MSTAADGDPHRRLGQHHPFGGEQRERGSREMQAIADEIAKAGGTPLAVAKDGKLLGVVTSRISSRAASASALPSCAAWVSAP